MNDQPKRKLSHEVKDKLHALIESGDLRPGDPLPSERELMRRFEVGRPAIREALQALERGGVVRIRHGGRARLTEPSLGSVLDLLGDGVRHALLHSPTSLEHLKEARLAFEVEMTRRAAQARTPEAIARLQERIAAQEALHDQPMRFLEADGEFHREIAVTTGNPIFAAVSDAMFRWLIMFHEGTMRAPGLERLVLDEHRTIADHIEAGRAQAAAQAMTDHLTRANALYQRVNFVPSAQAG